MQRYIARRIVSALPVLLIVSMLAFGGMELVPGGPIYAYLGANPEGASLSGAQLQEIKHQYGLDQSLPVRYVRWLDRAVHWDFGASIRTKQPVTKAIGERLSVSLWLSGITFVVHIIVGLSLGVLAGIKRGSKVDFGATSLAVLGSATPSFWLAILLIVVFAVHLGWFPASGWVDPLKTPSDAFKHLVLPVLSLGVFGSATVMRQTRSAVVEVMSEDYIRTARAKGAAERPGDLAACAQELPAAGRHGHGVAAGRPRQRQRADRARLRPAPASAVWPSMRRPATITRSSRASCSCRRRRSSSQTCWQT